jgi:hypothetical protein
MNNQYSYDMPSNYYFGGGGDTSVTLLALIVLLVAMGLLIGVRRRYVIVVLLVAGLLLPVETNIVIAGLHFQALRVLLGTAWLRLGLRRELRLPSMNSIDKAFLVWALANATFFSILWGTLSALTNRLGFLWTTLGSYFLVRLLIRNKADVVRVIRVLAITITIIAPALLIEHSTQRNLFEILGAPALSAIREGSIRAEGPFRHPIIAGTIGATMLPLFVGLWWQGKQHRAVLAMGMAASIGMVVASASSTPLMTCAAGIGGLLLWRFRAQLRILRWGAALGLVGLHLVMKAPVWMLIARAGGAIGGSGYHRAMLIDNFIRHFGEWWLLGTQNNAYWGYDMWDVDNAFVAAGVSGGLIAFLAFIAVFFYAYRRVGKSRRLLRRSRKDERLIWALGASLFANTVGFFGIIYFDQSILVWYSLLAMISATPAFLAEVKETPSDPESASAAEVRETQTPLAAPSYASEHLVYVTE